MDANVKKELEETLAVPEEKNVFKEVGPCVRALGDFEAIKGQKLTAAMVSVQWKNEGGMIFERQFRVEPDKVDDILKEEKERLVLEFSEICKGFLNIK